MCACIGKTSRNVQKTPSGLIFRQRWNNLQFVTSVDYILGDNPRATSYMVGYGNSYPEQVHHRGSSILSIMVNPSFVSCRGGYATLYSRKASDPNLLTGAIVGGPDQRDNFQQTGPI
ncbi:putative cellulase [Helianthus anomalus]